MQPLHSRGSPAPSAGTKSQVAPSPLPSRRPKRGHNCYVTRSPAFSGDLNKRHEITRGYLTPAFPGAQKRVELPCKPRILGGSQTPSAATKSKAATSPLPSRGSPTPNAGQKSELATSPLPSLGPKTRRSSYATPAFSRVPDAKRGDKITSGSLALAFSGGQKRVQLLCNP